MNKIDIRRLDMPLLLVFREVMRCGRASSAAVRLGVTQSAVSHSLARLQDILQTRLFERHPGGLRPTPQANELLPTVETIISLAEGLVAGAPPFDPTTSKRVFHVAANDYVCTILGGAFSRGLAEAPDVRLAFRFAVGETAFQLLRDGQVHMAVGRFYTLPADMMSTHLFSEHFVVVARAGHPAFQGGLELEAYLRYQHVLISFVGGMTGVVDEALAKKGMTRKVAISLPLFLPAFAMLSKTDLLCTVPARLAAIYAGNFGLEVRAAPLELPNFPVTAITHRRSEADAGLSWLSARIVAADPYG